MSGPNKYSANQGAMKNIMDKIIRTVSTEQVNLVTQNLATHHLS